MLIALLIGFLIIVMFAVYGGQGKRSFAVEAITSGATIIFDGSERAVWQLPGATLCIRKQRGSATPAAARDHPQCASALFDVRDIGAVELRWPAGLKVHIHNYGLHLIVTLAPDAEHNLAIGDDQASLPPGSRIILDRDLRGTWPLPVSGRITIGDLPGSGAEGILTEGRFVTRETLPGRSVPITISEGLLFAGDRVSFSAVPGGEEGWQPVSYGFLASTGDKDKDETMFRMVVYSELGPSHMRVERLGNQAAFITPAWTERAVKDPVLIGITVIVSALSLLLGIARKSFDFVFKGNTSAESPSKDIHPVQ